MVEDAYAPPPAPESSGRGCFFYGCLAAVILMFIGCLTILGGGYLMMNKVANTIIEYTEAEPMELPEVEISDQAWEELETRVNEFGAAVDAGQPAAPLVLTADDLNALVERHPQFAMVKDQLYFEIEDDTVNSQISMMIPQAVADLPLIGKKIAGRYFNGTCELSVSLRGGNLDVRIQSGSVKGEPIPPEILTNLRNENIADDFLQNNPEAQNYLMNFDSIEIEDGLITIVPRNLAQPEATPTGTPEPRMIEAAETPTPSPTPTPSVTPTLTVTPPRVDTNFVIPPAPENEEAA
jgi:hypothetical protein